jgi:energy-converting hydrogenase Eha subunit B
LGFAPVVAGKGSGGGPGRDIVGGAEAHEEGEVLAVNGGAAAARFLVGAVVRVEDAAVGAEYPAVFQVIIGGVEAGIDFVVTVFARAACGLGVGDDVGKSAA